MDSVTSTSMDKDEGTELPACEIALSIHHVIPNLIVLYSSYDPMIACKIFSALSTKDIFNCRLVSYNWKMYSTPSLQPRINKLKIYGFDSSSTSTSLKKQELRRKSIHELISIFEQVDPPGTFPCTKFHLKGGTIFDENRDIFLTNYGMYINDLSINIHPGQDLQKVPDTSILLEQITNLLKKIPNIKSLYLYVPSLKSGKSKSASIITACSSLLKSDPEFQLIEQNIQSSNIFNTKLKFLEIAFDTSAIVFEIMIQSCPNLQEVKLDVRNCDLYTSPLNRLHLLKRLEFYPFNDRIDKLEKLAAFAISKKNEEVLLQEIILDFGENIDFPEFSNPAFEQRVVNCLNDILECFKSSLEICSWNEMKLVSGIKFPKVMPKVHTIKFIDPRLFSFKHYFPREDGYRDEDEVRYLFPEGFSFAKTFPNLRYVYFYSDGWDEVFRKFLTWLNFDPVPWVEKVDIDWKSDQYDPFTEEDLRKARRIFPNAMISNLNVF